MDRFNGSLKLENKLQETYWEYIVKRSNEYIEKNLTGRLVIDFQKGVINSLQDQQIVAGVSALNFGLDKLNL